MEKHCVTCLFMHSSLASLPLDRNNRLVDSCFQRISAFCFVGFCFSLKYKTCSFILLLNSIEVCQRRRVKVCEYIKIGVILTDTLLSRSYVFWGFRITYDSACHRVLTLFFCSVSQSDENN